VLTVHLGFMCENFEQVKLYGLGALKQSIPFVGVVYNNVCLSSFATFSCQTLRDGSAVLRIAPSIVCYESDEHKTMIAISLLALIVYVFGLPMITLGTTLYASKWDKLRDENFLATIGLFYREYGAWGCTCVGVSVARRQHSFHRRRACRDSHVPKCAHTKTYVAVSLTARAVLAGPTPVGRYARTWEGGWVGR
jgi:hypothetical protein